MFIAKADFSNEKSKKKHNHVALNIVAPAFWCVRDVVALVWLPTPCFDIHSVTQSVISSGNSK